MIQIKRDNLHVLARRHYEEYFKKKVFRKVRANYRSRRKSHMQKFFTVIRNQIENIIMGNPNYLNEITININRNYRSVMGKIHNHNSLKKKLKYYEKQQKC